PGVEGDRAPLGADAERVAEARPHPDPLGDLREPGAGRLAPVVLRDGLAPPCLLGEFQYGVHTCLRRSVRCVAAARTRLGAARRPDKAPPSQRSAGPL